MKTFTGYIFTENPIHNLNSRGLAFQKIDRQQDLGCNLFLMSLENNALIEIREIIDEKLFLEKTKAHHFEPQIEIASDDLASKIKGATRPAFEFEWKDSIEKSMPLDADIYEYFLLRKEFPFWAIVLKTSQFEDLKKIARPDKVFNWKGQEALLIHLGPNCFDMLVVG